LAGDRTADRKTLRGGSDVTKVVNCRDVGFDCDGVVRAETEEEALQLVAEHAREIHGVQDVPPDVVEKVQAVMQEE
jgi:predicted small metal-binding protein